MIKKIIFLFLLLNWISCNNPESIDDYLGGWSGILQEPNSFLFTVELERNPDKKMEVRFVGQGSITKIELEKDKDNYLKGEIENQLKITVDTVGSKPVAFIQTGHHLSHLNLEKKETDKWLGEWNLLLGEKAAPTFYLTLDKSEDGNYFASPFFKEPTYHYMYGQNFSHQDNEIEFTDIRSNIKFNGTLKDGAINLVLSFLHVKTNTQLLPLPFDKWTIGEVDLENIESPSVEMQNGQFARLLKDIRSDTLERTHSVLVSQNGKIIFEHYFDGFSAKIPHDTRSLSKSFASAAIGIAISNEIIENEEVQIKGFLENQYPEIDWSNGKDSITIFHLLTMSSGLDVIDFGINRTSFANEGAYQNQEEWTEYILSAPMINKVGKEANYGSGSPHLLAPILANQLDARLEFFVHKKLFQPLGISNYRIQANNKDQVYFGGGWYLSPRDLLKFGQLYLNNGTWEGKQIMPQKWISKSLEKHFILENTIDKNEYGYLFWHKTYDIEGQKIESIEARGSGGQYLFIIPAYELIAVITSGNYRNNKGFQPEKIMEEYILPELIE